MFASVIFGIYNWIKANLWAVGLSITGAILSIISNRSGVGWSWDSTDYVAVGINIANGRGLLDVTGLPMTVRPPGLSALIAVGISLGISANLFLLLLNAICSLIVVATTYALLMRAMSDRKIIIIVRLLIARCNSAKVTVTTMNAQVAFKSNKNRFALSPTEIPAAIKTESPGGRTVIGNPVTSSNPRPFAKLVPTAT